MFFENLSDLSTIPHEDHLRSLPDRSRAALERNRPYVLTTPYVSTSILAHSVPDPVWLKCEHRQTTGSFKLRGALNKVLQLSRRTLDEGVVVASTGNHGAAVAYSCRLLGGRCTIVVPGNVGVKKARAMEALGATLVRHGSDGLEAERFAREMANRNELAFISPYNDIDVIAGQGTLALEMIDQLSSNHVLYVAVGGGGLIAGIAAAVKATLPDVAIVGCSPEAHPVMDASVAAGRIVELPYRSTLSDGTAGGLEADTITLPLCSSLVDDWIRVSEEEIRGALIALVREERMIVEGAAAVALAAARKDRRRVGRPKTVVLCGGNIDRDLLTSLLADAHD